MKTEPRDPQTSVSSEEASFWWDLKQAARLVGSAPPTPPTVRGRVGQAIIQVINRLLFWYSDQIRMFQRLSAQTHAIQSEQLAQVIQIVEGHDRLLNPSNTVPLLRRKTAPQIKAEEIDILTQIVSSSACHQNALDIFMNEWVSKMPASPTDLRAGKMGLFEDPKVQWALAEFGGVEGQRVLELGPMEGGHSYILQNCGARSVLAIESNVRAFLKCLIVKNIFRLDRVEYLCGDFLSYLKAAPQFDTVIASGVLYHMINPVELLQLVSKATGKLFMWTHYYDAALISKMPAVAHRMRDHQRTSFAGFAHMLHRFDYLDSLNANFAGGLQRYSCWMERQEILDCLRYFGFTDIRIQFEDQEHLQGPCFAFVAQRAALLH